MALAFINGLLDRACAALGLNPVAFNGFMLGAVVALVFVWQKSVTLEAKLRDSQRRATQLEAAGGANPEAAGAEASSSSIDKEVCTCNS
jgi:hypothetical protein